MHESSFNGFSEKGIQFLKDLHNNNSREWFQKNKNIFVQELENPAKNFSNIVSQKLEKIINVQVNHKIFRIFRDIRFSKDKTPYNTHVRISFIPESAQKDNLGNAFGFFFSLEPDKIILGAGIFNFSEKTLRNYQKIVDNPKTGKLLEKIINSLEKKGFFLEVEEYKRIPKGFDINHPRNKLLKKRGLAIFKKFKIPMEIHTAKASDFCIKSFKELLPIYKLLSKLN